MSVETAMTHPTPTGRRPALKPTGPADNLSWNLDAASLSPRRSLPPLALPALAMASGIALDRAIAPSDQRAWIASAVLAGLLIVAAIMFKRRGVGRFGLGLLLLGLGGAWHHGFWFERPADSLDRIDLESPTACRVRGVLLDIPERLPGGPFDPEGSTRLLLRTTAIDLGDGWRAASGGVLIYVNGRIDGLAMGGPALARGTLTAIEGPKNPGESDRREYWRSRGVGHRLRAERRGGLVPDSAGTPDAWLGLLSRLREHARRALVDRLDPEASAVASALVLGRREAIDPEVSEAFARTGVTHILAISGLHMVAVAGMLGLALSTLGWRRRPVSLAVLVATIAYAFLVGLRPSVVRASAMTVAGCYAGLRDRRPRMSDLLALAGPITLAINPAYLFDVGCQLSFLAVAALAWAGRPLARRFGLGVRPDRVDPEASPTAQLDALELQYGPAWRRWFHKWTASMTALLLASAAVWAVTLPLVAMRFHLVPIAGILLNLALVPMAAPILGTAVLALGLGLIDPPMAAIPAWACSRLIESMIGFVRFGAKFPGGFAFTAGPPGWWVAAFYGGLAMTAWASFRVGILRRVAWTSLLAWTAFGIGMATLPSRPTVAEADVLAVDHGLAVVVRSPTGRTLLYDCGRMYGPRVGREVVAPAIWAIGARRIDVAVISHADDDHYNGFADLMERIPIGEVRVSPGFDGPENPGAVALVARFRSRGVPVRPISAGDRIDLGDGFGAKVLHPPSGWMPDAPDNARSLVLDLGRLDGLGDRFLLTGDLEGAGLAEFWADPPPPPAAMLAPHHGGKASNPDWFYDAIRPDLLVASQRRPPYPETEALAPLERGGLPVWRTWRDGAIRLRWTNQGIRANSFLDSKRRVKSALLDFEHVTGLLASWNPPGWRWASAALAFLAGLTGALALGIVEFGAWTLVVPGRRAVPGLPSIEPDPWEPIAVTTADGTILAGAWLDSPGSDGRTVAIVHGFGEDRGALLGRAKALSAFGWNTAVLDSRARGGSGGDLTSFGARESADLVDWLDVLAERAGPNGKIAAWGRSMGASIALRAAAEDRRIRALVLEASYDDLRIAVAAYLRTVRVPPRFAGLILARAGRLAGISMIHPNPIDLAHRVSVPALLLHGEGDRIAPIAGARRLLEALGGPAELIALEKARHGDVFDVGGPQLVAQVADFLERAMAGDDRENPKDLTNDHI